jgi:hypothetical protein
MNRPATHERETESAAQRFVLPDEAVHEDFHRGLHERHLQMMRSVGWSDPESSVRFQANLMIVLRFQANLMIVWR